MKPEVLIFSASPSSAVMDGMEANFSCHQLWKVPVLDRVSYIERVGHNIRGILTVGSIRLDVAILDLLPRLEIVAVNSVGVDQIDLAQLRARGIPLTYTPGVLTDDVADLGVLLLLAVSRRLRCLDRYVRTGEWARGLSLAMPHSLKSKVVGIFGFGRIGQALAARLQSFGMSIRYYQPRPIENSPMPRDTSLLALASNSDYLVLCAPANESTIHAVDATVLAALGPQGTLINLARGALVDESALIRALQEGHLGGAGLDVFENEPEVPDALRMLDNVVLTPHIGSYTVETRHAMGQLAVDNLVAHFNRQPLLTPFINSAR